MSRVLTQAQQKLGQVDLPVYTGLEQPDAFEWAEIAAKNFDDSRHHIETIEAQLATQAETIGKLQSQLDSIVNAKAEHEGVLLHKFTELINSKKVKIRDQQRVLGTAKIDPDAGEYYEYRYIPYPLSSISIPINFSRITFFPHTRSVAFYPRTLTCYSGTHSTCHFEASQSRGFAFIQTQGQRSC